MLFYIKSNITVRVQGISGPFLKTASWLVNANTVNEAKSRYETECRQDLAHMNFESIAFEYTEITGELK